MNTLFCVTLTIVALTVHLSPVNGQEDPRLCPAALKELAESTNCAAIKCMSTLRQRDCPVGSFLEDNVQLCKCCPGCVKYLFNYNEDSALSCVPGGDLEQYDRNCNDRICPVIRQCRRGLICREDPIDNKNKCLLPEQANIPKPPDCAGLCWMKQAVAEASNWNWDWQDACTADGYFKPVQCKGNKYAGDCYCVDKCGEKIFGRARRDKAEGQTCECSRRVHELRARGLIASLHCTQEGNYEPLQCDTDSSLCYCMDPETGKLTSEVLPEHQWKNLPCYNASATNFEDDGRYLRRCESEWAAAQKIGQEARLHGLQFNHRSLTVNCDYDGSFGQVYIDVVDGRDFCSHKDGTQIMGFFRPLNNQVKMDCNCARDIVYYSVNDLEFGKTCDTRLSMGNYLPVYTTGPVATCVDADGYGFGPSVPADLACCLNTVRDNDLNYVNTCPLELQPQCRGETGGDPITQCALYSTLIRDHYVTSV